jgi:hypothetical protein
MPSKTVADTSAHVPKGLWKIDPPVKPQTIAFAGKEDSSPKASVRPAILFLLKFRFMDFVRPKENATHSPEHGGDGLANRFREQIR